MSNFIIKDRKIIELLKAHGFECEPNNEHVFNGNGTWYKTNLILEHRIQYVFKTGEIINREGSELCFTGKNHLTHSSPIAMLIVELYKLGRKEEAIQLYSWIDEINKEG